jgi:tetratricopeptide (TPR) repeat protein
VAEQQLRPARSGTRGFFGREHELRELRAAMDEAAAGYGRLMLVAGEPGIGKTRLAEELAAYATGVGARVLWGSCWEGDGAPAFWPWIQVLRVYVRDRDIAILQRELGSGAADVARLVPELAQRYPELPPPPPLESEQARFRLFDAVTAAFGRAADAQPFLFILDDLQWADRPSLLLLRFLAGELHADRILVLGAYRDVELGHAHPVSELLGELTSGHRRAVLTGLAASEVGRLVTQVAAEQPDPEIVAMVQEATGGNPFFVRQLTELLASQGRLHRTAARDRGVPGIPPGIREVVDRRLRQLSDPCAELLSAAAVLGQEFDLELVEPLVDLSRDQQLQLLTEASGARLVDESPGATRRYRFVHALVREVCYERLPVPQRARLHRLAGEAMEERYRDNLEGRLAELAHHFLQSAVVDGTTGKAVDYAERAGRRALALLAYEEATDHLLRVLQLLDVSAPTEVGRRCEVLLALGAAQMASSDIAAARESYGQAAVLAKRIGARELLARAALGLGVDPIGFVDDLEVRVLEEALELLSDDDSVMRARVLARLAKALRFSPLVERRRALSEQAVAMARRIGDPATLAPVLHEQHLAMWGGANPAERLTIATEVIEVAERYGDRSLALQGHAMRTGDLLELGDLQGLEMEIETYDRKTVELHQLYYRWHIPLLRASQAALAGRFAEAERLAAEGHALGVRAQNQAIAVFVPVVIGMIRFAQGRFHELEALLREQVDQYPSLPEWRGALAYALAEADRREEARVVFERLAADDFGRLPRDVIWVGGLAFCALTCSLLEDQERAATLYELLLPHAGFNVRVSRIGIGSMGAVEHYLGLLAATMGHLDGAVRHFEAAMRLNARMGAACYLANSRYQYARVLRARGASGHHELADDHMGRAIASATALGIELQLRRPDAAREAAQPEPLHGAFSKEGEYWTIGYQGHVIRLRESIGLAYLVRLIAEPRREFHALDLAVWTSGGAAGSAPSLQEGEELLDQQARAAYRHRIAELTEELEEAQGWGDTERAARARHEIDAITEQLAAAVGLGGRDRRAASEAERARVSVTKALKSAIRRIAAQDAELGEHLAHSVKTGTFVAYDPDPAVSISWAV